MRVLTEATRNKLRDISMHPDDRIEITAIKGGDKLQLDMFSIMPSGDKTYPRDWSLMSLPHILPEKKRIEQYKYEFPPTDTNLEIIEHLLLNKYKDQISLDQHARLHLQVVKTGAQIKDDSATNIARWREDNKIPYHCKFLMDHKERPLTRYQQIASYNCLSNPNGYALFMEQGTGKTPVAINVMCNEAKRKLKTNDKELYRVLVICPKNVRYNWDSELEKFATVKYKTTIIRGSALDRETDILWSLFKDPEDIEMSVVVASYDSISRSEEVFALEKVAGKKVKVKWDLVILDESHYIKTPRAKRTKACLKLRDASLKRMILTGTPITNTLLDLWSQLEFVEENGSGFSSFHAYKDFYGVYRLDQMGRKQLVDFENIPFIQERLAKQAFIVKSEEALPDLPEKVYDAIECNITKEQRETYMKVAAGIRVQAEEAMNSANGRPQSMVANNILTKMLKLAQVTSGFLKYDDIRDEETGDIVEEGHLDRFDPNPKLETLIEVLKDKEAHQKTIVWCHFKQDIMSIAARCRLEGIDCETYYSKTSDKDRNNAVYRFNCDPSCRVFIGNAGSGGTGLNLLGYDHNKEAPNEKTITSDEGEIITNQDTLCDHAIYFSQDWSQPKRSQSEKRIHRKGTKAPVRISDLVVPGSIDSEIRHRVQLKIETANEISDVKDILTRLITSVPSTNGD